MPVFKHPLLCVTQPLLGFDGTLFAPRVDCALQCLSHSAGHNSFFFFFFKDAWDTHTMLIQHFIMANNAAADAKYEDECCG